MNDFAISIIRTLVPSIVGGVLGFLAARGINIDESTATALQTALTGLFTALYYGLVRLLETKFSDKFGWLLGYAKKPEY